MDVDGGARPTVAYRRKGSTHAGVPDEDEPSALCARGDSFLLERGAVRTTITASN